MESTNLQVLLFGFGHGLHLLRHLGLRPELKEREAHAATGLGRFARDARI